VRKIDLGSPPSFFYSPVWSPDGKKVAFTDKRRNLWYVEIENGVPARVDSDRYEDPFRESTRVVARQPLPAYTCSSRTTCGASSSTLSRRARAPGSLTE
jgi:Tol biopolymer transport system component